MKKPHLLKWINNIKIREKLLFSYMLVVFLPVLLVGFILNYNMRSIIVENAKREASVNIDRISLRMNEVMKLIMDVSTRIQMDQNLERLFLKKYTSTQEVFESYYDYSEFNNILNLYSLEIKAIRLYSYNESILDNGQFIKITPAIKESAWYDRVNRIGGRICWQYLQDENKSSFSLCLTRLIKTINSNRMLGALVISVNGDYFYSMIKSEPYDTFFIDDTGIVFSSSDKALIGQNIQKTGIAGLGEADDGVRRINYAGRPVIAIIRNFCPSQFNGTFKIVSIVPLSAIEKQTGSSALLVLIIMISSLLLAAILILIFSDAISKRIKTLSKDMHTVAMGDFDLSPAIEGEDEIGQLSVDLKVMTKSIRDLVQEVYITKAQKDQLAIKQKEIKLKMLANQINPHFLFNALETIRMKAHCSGEEELAEIVKLLGKIMRKNLEVGSEMITIESEIDLVKCYLEIQRFRYGEKISYDIRYESEDIKEHKIIPLIIQPLVENAIVHGLEWKEGDGHVSIHLARRNLTIIITVQDDGQGMTVEKLQEIHRSLDDMEETPGKRIGLKNVHQRLKLFYGDEYGLRIFSGYNSGTRVELLMPEEGWSNAQSSDCR